MTSLLPGKYMGQDGMGFSIAPWRECAKTLLLWANKDKCLTQSENLHSGHVWMRANVIYCQAWALSVEPALIFLHVHFFSFIINAKNKVESVWGGELWLLGSLCHLWSETEWITTSHHITDAGIRKWKSISFVGHEQQSCCRNDTVAVVTSRQTKLGKSQV